MVIPCSLSTSIFFFGSFLWSSLTTLYILLESSLHCSIYSTCLMILLFSSSSIFWCISLSVSFLSFLLATFSFSLLLEFISLHSFNCFSDSCLISSFSIFRVLTFFSSVLSAASLHALCIDVHFSCAVVAVMFSSLFLTSSLYLLCVSGFLRSSRLSFVVFIAGLILYHSIFIVALTSRWSVGVSMPLYDLESW